MPQHIIEEMRHFFGVYKQLEGKKMEVLELSGQRRIVNATNTANIIKIFEQNVIVHIAKITLSKISGA